LRFRSGRGRVTNRRLNAIDAFYAGASPKGVAPIPRRTRAQNKPRDPKLATEHQEQTAVIQWWNLSCAKYGLPAIALFAIPNGGARDYVTGAMLKAEGVRRGVFDLMLAKPASGFHGLYLEMKVGANKASDDQLAFKAYLESVGYKALICYSAEVAISHIEEYLHG
jgi:hypothetical protein